MKHNQVVQTIINHIICRSRKSSIDHVSTKTTHQHCIIKPQEQDDNSQEYIIQKGDLRQVIEKVAKEHLNKDITIDKLNQQIASLNIEIKKQKQFMHASTSNNNSKDECSAYKDHLIKKYASDLSLERKINQKLEEDYQEITQRLKTQLKQTEKLKLKLIQKQEIIHKLNQKNTPKTMLTEQMYTKQTFNQQYFTPKKQNTKKMQLTAYSIESIKQTLNTEPLNNSVNFYNPTIKNFQTQVAKQNQQPSIVKTNRQKDFGLDLTQSQLSMKAQKIKLELLINKKNRYIKLLGAKCASLQYHIQKLTKNLLQQKIISSQPKKLLLNKKLCQNVHGIQQIEQEEKVSQIESFWQQLNTQRA